MSATRRTRAGSGILALLLGGATGRAEDLLARPQVVLVGDTQRTSFAERLLLREQNDAAREALVRAVGDANPRLLVILGDVVTNGGDAGAWRYFDQLVAPLRERGILMEVVLGNHDYIGARHTMTTAVSARFASFGPKSWSVVRSGAIALVLLDSNFEKLGGEAAREQQEWYAAELARLERDDAVRSIVVCCHHPPFTNSRVVSPSEEVERRLVPPFLAARKAVLFASGHCHSFEHFRHRGKDFIVTGGGGGPRQRVQVDARRRRFEDHFAGSPIRAFHYCRLDEQSDRLAVTMVCLDAGSGSWGVCDRFLVAPDGEVQ